MAYTLRNEEIDLRTDTNKPLRIVCVYGGSAAPFCPPNMNMFQAHYQNPEGQPYFGYPQPYGLQGQEGINPNVYAYPMPFAEDRNAMYSLPPPPNLQMNPTLHMAHAMVAPVVMSETGSETSHGEWVVRNIGIQHQYTTCVTPSCHRSPPLSDCETTSPNMPDLPTGSIAPALKLNYDYSTMTAKGYSTVTTNSTKAPILCNSEVESRSNCGSNYGAQAPACQLSLAQIYAGNGAAANAARGYMPNMPNYAMPPMLLDPGTGPRTEFAWLRTDRSHAVGAGTNNLRVRRKEKYRCVYSELTRLELEKAFCTNKYITIHMKAKLAKTLVLTPKQVKIWFQNRRAKERRSTGKTPLDQQADSDDRSTIIRNCSEAMRSVLESDDNSLKINADEDIKKFLANSSKYLKNDENVEKGDDSNIRMEVDKERSPSPTSSASSHSSTELPRGRNNSPGLPFRKMWDPKERLAKAIANNEGPDYELTLHGHGEIEYLGTKYGIILSHEKRNVVFEIEEALWPTKTRLQIGDWVRFDSIYWPKEDMVNFNRPKYEATQVRLLDTAHDRSSSWKCTKDVRHIDNLPRKLEGTGMVWYKGAACSLMRDQKTGQHIFFYNHILPGVNQNAVVEFSARRKIRHIGKHGIWTEFDAVDASFPRQSTRDARYKIRGSRDRFDGDSRSRSRAHESHMRAHGRRDSPDARLRIRRRSQDARDILRSRSSAGKDAHHRQSRVGRKDRDSRPSRSPSHNKISRHRSPIASRRSSSRSCNRDGRRKREIYY